MSKPIILTGYAEWATPVVRTGRMDVYGKEYPIEDVVLIHDRAYVFEDIDNTKIMDLHTGKWFPIREVLIKPHE